MYKVELRGVHRCTNAKVTGNLSVSAVWGRAFKAGITTAVDSDRFHAKLLATF
tara:strand:+ start:1659 stop:1817 length:159 start_codon:yes stop_codon:yes gene_type:complete